MHTLLPKYNNFNLLNANPTKWSNTLKQLVGKLPTNCLSVFDQFVGLVFKGLRTKEIHVNNKLLEYQMIWYPLPAP